MNVYIASDGDRIDQIAFSHYGSLSNIESVLQDNEKLLNKVALNAGDKVFLRDFKEVEPSLPSGAGVAIW